MDTITTRAALKRIILRWASLIVLLCCSPSSFAQDFATGAGAVDALSYDPARRELVVSGWAASTRPQVFVTGLRVELGGHAVYQSGRWEHQQRDDVARVTQRPDWQHSGYRIVAHIPTTMACQACSVRVQARLGDGKVVELQHAPQVTAISTEAQRPRGLPAWFLLTLLGLPAVLVVVHAAMPAQPIVLRWCGPRAVAAAVALTFASLVATGTTGSSLPLLLQGIHTVQGAANTWLGQSRPIRSDEWEVITPMALSQQAHLPRYPIVNSNWGAGGHNMLVVGMSGLPVRHASTMAKPATWGFFVLPLQQALAWYWWFPFFGCFAVLWTLLQRLGLPDWRAAAAWAAALAYSPYSVAFSGWPAYLLFFGAAALLCGMQALRSPRWTAALWGVALGIAAAGYALVLYPAWQISLGYLLVGVALAWVWTERRNLNWGAAQGLALILAIATASLLLTTWWQDAAPAVHAIQNTIYPGQRSTTVGGDIDAWYLIKGLLSAITMYQVPPLMDASDAGSIIWLVIPLLLAALWQVWRRKSLDALGLVLLAFIAFALAYAYLGLPEPLARISQWGRVISYRLDLALGLAQLLLLVWLWRSAHIAPRWLAALAAALSLAVAGWCWRLLPAVISDVLPAGYLWLSALAWALAAWWLVIGRYAAASGLLASWLLASALPFNPLVQAPQSLVMEPALARELKPGTRVAVLGDRRWSLVLPAAGVAVVNAVHYHPPNTLWRQLDPQGLQASVHNRYQRLLLRLQDQPVRQQPFAVHSPRLDEVVLTLDPGRFGFALLQATHVLAAEGDTTVLGANPGLVQAASGTGWVLWRVL